MHWWENFNFLLTSCIQWKALHKFHMPDMIVEYLQQQQFIMQQKVQRQEVQRIGPQHNYSETLPKVSWMIVLHFYIVVYSCNSKLRNSKELGSLS